MLVSAIVILFTSYALQAQGVTELLGRAVLPPRFAVGPTSGQFLNLNNDGKVGSATRFNRIAFPFLAQPVQGFSAVLSGSKSGTYRVLADNGYGSKANSADFLLRAYAIAPQFPTGSVRPAHWRSGNLLSQFTRDSFLQLNDRNQVLKGRQAIVADLKIYPQSEKLKPGGIPVAPQIQQNRLLTGADFDPESFQQAADGSYWFGDEFGPFLLHTDAKGTLLQPPIPTPNPLDQISVVRSPDHPDFVTLPEPDRVKAANLPRSRGFEGMALSVDGTKLYPLLEGAIATDPDPRRLFMLEFDLRQQRYTGNRYRYRLEDPKHAIGDLVAINADEFLVIERDSGSGNANNPAFKTPAQFKRIYKINIRHTDTAGFVAKEWVADLLSIRDSRNLGGMGTQAGIFTFPFVTIENALPLNAQTLLVINDNNYPLSAGRIPNAPDATEIIQIRLSKTLR